MYTTVNLKNVRYRGHVFIIRNTLFSFCNALLGQRGVLTQEFVYLVLILKNSIIPFCKLVVIHFPQWMVIIRSDLAKILSEKSKMRWFYL